MAVVIALAFGRSQDPKKPLPFNEFLSTRLKDWEELGYKTFNDLGDPQPTLLTVDRAIKYAKESGDSEFILLAATNGHDMRAEEDIKNSAKYFGLKDVPEIEWDILAYRYPGELYSSTSTHWWTRSKLNWYFYNTFAYMLSCVLPGLYRQKSYKQKDLNKRI
jgi:hypothetical protein